MNVLLLASQPARLPVRLAIRYAVSSNFTSGRGQSPFFYALTPGKEKKVYRLASYDFAAHIHLYQWKELTILLDVNSGAIHVLDETACDFINSLIQHRGDFYLATEDCSGRHPAPEVMEVAREILALYEEGEIFTAEEEISLDLSVLPLKALCLNVAHACNMKCSYCFAQQGNFGMKPALMSFDIGKKAFDFLIGNSGQVKNLEVDFFGGEPLLNFEVVKSLVLYGRRLEEETGKHFNFTLTTNALLLDEEIRDFIIEHDMAVILSLDGRPQTNDRHRILNNDEGSYALVLPRIRQMVAANPVSYYIRGTFTRHNLDFVEDLRHIIDLGFNNLSLEPAIGADSPYAIREQDLPRVLKEYETLTDTLLEYDQRGQDIHFFHYNLNLQQGPCLAKRRSGCGAGVDYLAVTPEGDIYPCHQFVGEKNFCMGNVADGLLDRNVRHRFQTNHLGNKAQCRQCWARNFCGGGCHANNFFSNGDIAVPAEISCTMHKKRIEGAIYQDLHKRVDKNQKIR